MKKKKTLIFTVLCALLALFSISVYATKEKILIFDNAKIFDIDEYNFIENKILETSENLDLDIYIVTTSFLVNETNLNTSNYTEEFLSSHTQRIGETLYTSLGHSIDDDGIVIVRYVNQYDMYLHILPFGNAEEILTKGNCEKIVNSLDGILGSDPLTGDYKTFFYNCLNMIEETYENHGKLTSDMIFVVLLIALIVSFAIVMYMKSKLKSVRSKAFARSYLKKDSFNLTVCNDTYLYKNVTRVRIQSNSSGSGGRSGGSRGGGGRV